MVANYGGNFIDMYINTINFGDIATSWIVSRAILRQGQNDVNAICFFTLKNFLFYFKPYTNIKITF